MKLVGLILILYFDENHRSFMIVVGFEKKKILGVYIFVTSAIVFRV